MFIFIKNKYLAVHGLDPIKKFCYFLKRDLKESDCFVLIQRNSNHELSPTSIFLNAQKKLHDGLALKNCYTEWHQSMPCLILLVKAISSRF